MKVQAKSYPNQSRGKLLPLVLLGLLTPLLCSCNGNLWNRDYRLRFWEKNRLAAESAYLKKDYRAARDYAILAVREAEDFGNGDFRLGVSLGALGDACRKLGDHAEAEANYERALVVLRAAQKKCSDDTVTVSLIRQDIARVLNSMGHMYASERKSDLAIANYEKAARIYHELCSPVNGQLHDYFLAQEEARTLFSLAKAYTRDGNTNKANAVFRQAIAEARLADLPELAAREILDAYMAMLRSSKHEDVARDMLSYLEWQDLMAEAQQLCEAQQWKAAEDCLTRCLQLAMNVPERPECQTKTLAQLTTVFVKTDRLTEAERTCDQAMRLLPQSSNEAGFDVDNAMTLLGVYYNRTRVGTKALPLLRRQLLLRANLFGVGSIQTADILAGMAAAFQASGNIYGANQSADRARQILLPAFAGSKRGVAALIELGKVYQLMGNFVRAEEMYRAALDSTLRRCAPGDQRVISIRQSVIQSLLLQKKYSEAEDEEKRVVESLKNASADERIQSIPYLVFLCDTYLTLNRIGDLQPIVTLAAEIAKQPGVPAMAKAAVDSRYRLYEQRSTKDASK